MNNLYSNITNNSNLDEEKYQSPNINRFDFYIKRYKDIDLLDFKRALKLNYSLSKIFRESIYHLEYDLNVLLTSDHFWNKLINSIYFDSKNNKIKIPIEFGVLSGKNNKYDVELQKNNIIELKKDWIKYVFADKYIKNTKCSFHNKLAFWLYVDREIEPRKVKKYIGTLREIRNSLSHSSPILYLFSSTRISILKKTFTLLYDADLNYLLRKKSKRTTNIHNFLQTEVIECIKIIESLQHKWKDDYYENMSKEHYLVATTLKNILGILDRLNNR